MREGLGHSGQLIRVEHSLLVLGVGEGVGRYHLMHRTQSALGGELGVGDRVGDGGRGKLSVCMSIGVQRVNTFLIVPSWL